MKILNKNMGGYNVIECKVRNGKHKAYYMTMKRDLKYGALLKRRCNWYIYRLILFSNLNEN